MKKIVSAKIKPMPRPLSAGMAGGFDPMPRVAATFEEGEIKELFWFYPDELSFEERELVGLTEREAYELRHKKDIAYLRR